MRTISSWLALAFGLSLAVLEVVRNWGHWEWWPFWLVDYISASMLVAGGLTALKTRATPLLCAAWGFSCAMFWMSFFGHLDEAMKSLALLTPRDRSLTTAIGGMFVITVVGMTTALWASIMPERRR